MTRYLCEVVVTRYLCEVVVTRYLCEVVGCEVQVQQEAEFLQVVCGGQVVVGQVHHLQGGGGTQALAADHGIVGYVQGVQTSQCLKSICST